MDVRHINAFVVIAEEGNFTKAARRLNVSQPPLSRLIQQLEVELGVALFSRSHRGAELTRHGRLLLEKARAVTEAANSFQQVAETMTGTASRTIHLGTAWGLWAAVDRIREHHARRVPDACMAVSDLYSHADRHEPGVPDVILLRGAADHSEYESSALFTERLVAVLATTHPLASRARLTLEDLATQQLLMCARETDPGLFEGTRALVASSGWRRSASPFTQTLHASGVAVVPIDEPGARIEIHLALRRRERSDHLTEFRRSAREAFRLRVAGRRNSSASAFAV
jgi:DNA-binding transcriptional LysR family regulator